MNDNGGFYFVWEKREFNSLSQKKEKLRNIILLDLNPVKS